MLNVISCIYKSPLSGLFVLFENNNNSAPKPKPKTISPLTSEQTSRLSSRQKQKQMNIIKNRTRFGKNKIVILVLATAIVSLVSLLFFVTPGQSVATTILDTEINAQALITLTNQIREVKELPPLISNIQLMAAAEAKAENIIKYNYFSHTSPAGQEFFTWIEEAGYQYQIIGENLAVGFATNKEAMKAWMDSPAHRDNILNEKYREIGIVVKQGKLGEQDQLLIVQIFGAPHKLRLSEIFSGFNKFLETNDYNLYC